MNHPISLVHWLTTKNQNQQSSIPLSWVFLANMCSCVHSQMSDGCVPVLIFTPILSSLSCVLVFILKCLLHMFMCSFLLQFCPLYHVFLCLFSKVCWMCSCAHFYSNSVQLIMCSCVQSRMSVGCVPVLIFALILSNKSSVLVLMLEWESVNQTQENRMPICP